MSKKIKQQYSQNNKIITDEALRDLAQGSSRTPSSRYDARRHTH